MYGITMNWSILFDLFEETEAK